MTTVSSNKFKYEVAGWRLPEANVGNILCCINVALEDLMDQLETRFVLEKSRLKEVGV